MPQDSQLVTKHVAICVDDFGLHEGINQAALDLAEKKRISSISCLVEGPAWRSGAEVLKDQALNAEIGLHLNLTENLGQKSFCRPLPRLIVLSYVRRLNPGIIRQSIARQFELFESAMGRPPDFVDGHQHVHQLPVIREALLDVMGQRQLPGKLWLRSTRPPESWARLSLPLSARLKSWLIGALGAPSLARRAAEWDYPQNAHLLGVHGFDGSAARYLHKLDAWFMLAQDGDVLMCHPSIAGPWHDPLLQARHREYTTLASDAFPTLTSRTGIVIRPLTRPAVNHRS